MTESQSASSGVLASTATSRSLLVRLKANDQAAWDRLVTLYGPMVFAWCRRWQLQDQDIADVFQEVFQAVAANVARFRKDQRHDTFRGWLRTIARNKVYDHFRRLGREPGGAGGTEALRRMAELPDAEDLDGDEPAGADHDDYSLLHRGLELIRGEFEARTWQAFWQTTVEGRVAADVGAELSMSAGAVRVAKSRVLKRLREELGES